MCQGDSLHGSLKFLNVVAVVARSVCLHFMGKPLLVMAFEIGQEVGPIPTTVAPYAPIEIASIAHGRLRIGVSHFAPEHEATIGQNGLFCIAA